MRIPSTQPFVGQAFGPAAGLPPGAELYFSGSAGDLVAGDLPPKAAA